MQLSKNKKVNILFFISLFGIVSALLFLYYASDKSAKVQTPSFVATSPTHGVVLATDANLYHTDESGQLLAHYGVKELGLDTKISDLKISEDALYVANAQTHTIYKCSFPLTQCQRFTEVPNLHQLTAMKIAFTPDQKNFYVSSSQVHKIDYFDINGEHLYTLDLRGELLYPNSIVVTKYNTLIVADTNHHRVLGIRNDDNKIEILWKLHFKGLYSWPVYLALDPNDALWIATLDGFLDKGEVLISSDYINTSEILYAPKRPKAMQAIQNGMLISDSDHFSFVLNDFSGTSTQTFGDPALQSHLKNFYDEKEFYELEVTLAQTLLGVFIFILIGIAFYEVLHTKDKSSLFSAVEVDRVRALKKKVLIEPDHKGVIWLKMNTKRTKQIKMLAIAVAALSVASVVLLIVAGITDTEILTLMGIIVIVMEGSALFGLKALKQQVGVDDQTIYIRDMFNNIVSDHIKNTVFSGRRLFVGEKSVVLYDGHQELLFDADEFACYIQPLLEHAQKKGELQIFFEKLFSGDLQTWGLLFFTTVLITAYIWLHLSGFIL